MLLVIKHRARRHRQYPAGLQHAVHWTVMEVVRQELTGLGFIQRSSPCECRVLCCCSAFLRGKASA